MPRFFLTVRILRTLVDVFNGLQCLRSQGKFTDMALHEQNKADLQGYDQVIQRTFQSLQVCTASRHLLITLIRRTNQVRLQLYALRSLSNQTQERLFDRLGAAADLKISRKSAIASRANILHIEKHRGLKIKPIKNCHTCPRERISVFTDKTTQDDEAI